MGTLHLIERAEKIARERRVGTGKKHLVSMSLIDLGKKVFGNGWIDGPHIDFLNQKLMQIVDGSIKRMIIEMPPRYAKTTMACQLLVPKYLSRHKHHRAIYTTYQAEKASEWGRKCRDVVELFSDDLGIQVRQDSRASNSWNLRDCRGGMLTAGVGGPLIGSGANLMVIDDPIKNHEEAESPLQRDKLWDWIQSTAFTRLEPDAAVVVIMHRWGRDDIIGRIKREAQTTGEKWEVLTLPALAGENDMLGREPGKCLWPQRFRQEEVEERKKTTTPRWWFALYDQNPQLEEGAEWPASWFEDVWVDDFPPARELVVKTLALDPSKGKTDKRGDYSAYVGLAMDRVGTIYLGADMSNTRDPLRIVQDGLNIIQRWKPDGFAVETNAFAELFGLLFKTESEQQRIWLRFDPADNRDGPMFLPVEHYQSKVGRIREWSKPLGYRKVKFVRSWPQTQLLLDQFMMFPTGGNDPGVDDGPDAAQMSYAVAQDIMKHGSKLIRAR